MTPPQNITELHADLTVDQHKRLDDITRAKMTRDAADEHYKKLLYEANAYHDLSWGIIGHHVGVGKEAVWRLVQRWKKGRK